MALSGYFNTSAYNNLYIEFSWTGVQSISGNYTDVSWKATAKRSSGSGGYYAHWWIYVDGELVNSRSQSNRILITNGMQIASGTKRIYHGTNGTRSFSASVEAAIYSYASNCTGSGSWTLNTIPRYANPKPTLGGKTETSLTVDWSADGTVDSLQYSTDNGSTWSTATNPNASNGAFTISGLTAGTTYPVVLRARRKDSQLTNDSSAVNMETYPYPYASSMPDFTIGQSVTIGLFNPMGRAVDVDFLANGNVYANASATGSSITLTPQDTLYSLIPNALSGEYSIRVTYGANQTTNTGGRYKVDENASKPVIGALTYEDINATTAAVTQDTSKIVQNLSTPRYRATGCQAKNSATLASVEVIVNNTSYTGTAGATIDINGGVINSAADVIATMTLTDSRGLTATKSVTVKMIAWTNPSAIITAQRKSNFYSETDVKVDASYTEIGANSIQITLVGQAVPIAGQTTPSDVTATLPDNVAQVISFDNDFAWNVTFTLTDTLGGSTVYRIYLQRGIPLAYFDRHRSSVALEKFPEHDQSFEVNGDIYGHDIYADGDIDASDVKINGESLLSKIYPVGSVYISVVNTNPATLFGGTWEQIQDTFLLASGSTYAAGSTGGEASHTLSLNEIPSHDHGISDWRVIKGYSTSGKTLSLDGPGYWDVKNPVYQGGGQAHNNMPPYLAVYMWKRTA